MPTKAKTRAGWTRVTFGDVVRQVRDIVDPEEDGLERYVAGEHMDTDDLRLRRWGTVGDGYLGPAFHMRFKPGHVLYGSRRTYLRKVAVADFEGVTANTTFVLESMDPSKLLPELLPFVMQTESFHEHSIKQSKGSVNPYVNFSDLTWYEFALPPLDEQRRIIDVLAASSNALEAARNLGATTAQLIRGLLDSVMFSGSEAHLGDVPSVPGTWKVIPAEGLSVELVTKGATPTSELRETDTGTPFIKVYNLTFDGVLDFSVEPTYVTRQGHEANRRSRIQAGDVLMNIVGPPLGKLALVPQGFPEANINQAIVRYRCATGDYARWLLFYLRSGVAQRWLFGRSKKTSGQRNLTLAMCRELPVPVPPPEEMATLLRRLTEINERQEKIRKRVASIASVRDALLSSALSEGCIAKH